MFRTNRRQLVSGALVAGVVASIGGFGAIAQDASPVSIGSTTDIVTAAEAFLVTLDATQRSAVNFSFPTDQTVATAVNFGGRVGEQFGEAIWSNYPISDVIRPGLRLGDLTEDQRQAAMRVLTAALSPEGFKKVLNIMESDQVLSEGGTNYASGRDNYVLGLFGTPSATEKWMVQFGGHHLGLNITMQGADQVLAPMLTGCQPSSFTDAEGNIIRPLGAETDDGFTLINALDADQQAQAILSYAQSDLVLGPGHDGQMLQPEGIAAANLNSDQQELLVKLVSNWVGILNDAAARAKLNDVRTNLMETYFAWSGDTTPGSASYFRITGPTIIIEFAPQGAMGGGPGQGQMGGNQGSPAAGGAQGRFGENQSTPSTGDAQGQFPGAQGSPQASGELNPYETGGANHIHSIYRDPTNEYGTGLRA